MIARVGRGGGGVGVEESLFVGIVESVVPGWSSHMLEAERVSKV